MIFPPLFLFFAVGRLGLELLEILDVGTHPLVHTPALIPIAGIEHAGHHHHLDEFDEVNEDCVQRGNPDADELKTTRLQPVTTVAAEQVFAGIAVAALAAGAPFA